MSHVKCPVCLDVNGTNCLQESAGGADRDAFACELCGDFELSRSLYAGRLDPERNSLTPMRRAALSHRIRIDSWKSQTKPLLTSERFEAFMSNPVLPTPAVQAMNAIRFIGDTVTESGLPVQELQPAITSFMGAPNPVMAGNVLRQLVNGGLLEGQESNWNAAYELYLATLTLVGWERYETEKHGSSSGNYGFLALQFGDGGLDAFVRDVLKPGLKDALDFEVVDMRDRARAGIIDNILRATIRDAAFILADLTHDNAGAYWEAGYAEGLGKPVIYICEAKKFDQKKSHFDTNHSTTVPWSADDPERFKQELVATLRRSLNLFS